MRHTKVVSVMLPSGEEDTPVLRLRAAIDNDAIKLIDVVEVEETVTLQLKSLAVIHCTYDEADKVDPHDEYIFEDVDLGKLKTSSPTFYNSMFSLINALESEQLTIFDIPIIIKRHKAKDNGGSFFSVSL